MPAEATAIVSPTDVPSLIAAPAADNASSTSTDDTRQDILDAITRANNGWTAAKSSLDLSALDGNVADQELADDTAAVDALQAAGQYETATQESISITDVTLDALDHATVHTTELWDINIFHLSNHQLVQPSSTTTYHETYTVEFQNGG